MPPTPTLRPRPGMSGVPTLTVERGLLSVRGSDGERTFPLGPAGVSALAHYTTLVVSPERTAAGRTRGLPRSGWRLLDGQGRTIAWLANLDREAYAPDEAAQFCRATGLRSIELGFIDHGKLLASSGERLGPGTSTVASFVAPAYQWWLTGACLGGVTLTGGLLAWAFPSAEAGWVIGGFLGLFVGVLLGGYLGMWQAAWGERRYYRKNTARGLRTANRVPGLILTCGGSRLEVNDFAKRVGFALDASLVLCPYDLPGSGRYAEHGLLVRGLDADASATIDAPRSPSGAPGAAGPPPSGAPGVAGPPPPGRQAKRKTADIAEPFDPAEVTAFAARHGIRVAPVRSAAELPKKAAAENRIHTRLPRQLSRLAVIVPVAWALLAVAVVVAVLGLAGVVELAVAPCVALLGLALTTIAGYGLTRAQSNDSLVHPERLS